VLGELEGILSIDAAAAGPGLGALLTSLSDVAGMLAGAVGPAKSYS
jgi:hypothetical protein